jgi:hypothetical protein
MVTKRGQAGDHNGLWMVAHAPQGRRSRRRGSVPSRRPIILPSTLGGEGSDPVAAPSTSRRSRPRLREEEPGHPEPDGQVAYQGQRMPRLSASGPLCMAIRWPGGHARRELADYGSSAPALRRGPAGTAVSSPRPAHESTPRCARHAPYTYIMNQNPYPRRPILCSRTLTSSRRRSHARVRAGIGRDPGHLATSVLSQWLA